jgi:hypothetical protein
VWHDPDGTALDRHAAAGETVMIKSDPAIYHEIYGITKPRATYYKHDFLDYVLMLLLTALVTGVLYGFGHVMSFAGFGLCGLMLVMFIARHGVELRVPLILKRPQDVLYMFVYKLKNLRALYFFGLGVLVLENVVIAATPDLPHHVDWMRKAALGLFYFHFVALSVYRTVILADHLRKKELVREVLMQTPWKRVINAKTKMAMEIVHAYGTGLLTHIVLIGPWYFLITHVRFSVLFLVPVAAINFITYMYWMGTTYNSWFYRDHWLGHNSELEFVYLHGTHHDAIPSALIAVSENGFLEGCLRHTIGIPAPFGNPIGASLVYGFEVKNDIDLHQYIPGVFPQLARGLLEATQHSTHHYGRLEPYGLAMKLDAPGVSAEVRKQFGGLSPRMKYSIRLDEELTGFQWENATHRLTLSLFDKYQPDGTTTAHPAPPPETSHAAQYVNPPSTVDAPAESVS